MLGVSLCDIMQQRLTMVVKKLDFAKLLCTTISSLLNIFSFFCIQTWAKKSHAFSWCKMQPPSFEFKEMSSDCPCFSCYLLFTCQFWSWIKILLTLLKHLGWLLWWIVGPIQTTVNFHFRFFRLCIIHPGSKLMVRTALQLGSTGLYFDQL